MSAVAGSTLASVKGGNNVGNNGKQQRKGRLLGGTTGKGFVPGRSGNPLGRPLTTGLLEALRAKVLEIGPDGQSVATKIAQGVRLASMVLAGGAGALYLSQSSFWSLTADIAGASAGSVSGFMNMGGQIGGALTGSLTPWIAVRYGWTASFLVAAGLCLLGAVSWLVVDPRRTLSDSPTV